MTRQTTTFARDRRLLHFWENLRPGYEFFERTRIPPAMQVDNSGRYVLSRASSALLSSLEDSGRN
ncbi:MAG: hypothetical protein ACREIV_06240 [Planctomycetaceae bacterium]